MRAGIFCHKFACFCGVMHCMVLVHVLNADEKILRSWGMGSQVCISQACSFWRALGVYGIFYGAVTWKLQYGCILMKNNSKLDGYDDG